MEEKNVTYLSKYTWGPMISAVVKLIPIYHPKNKMRLREVSNLPKVTELGKHKAGV